MPRASLLFSPRNKIIATSLLIEAILYESQTRRGLSNLHLEALEDLADHCTLCMKCRTPCPVKINLRRDYPVACLLERSGKASMPDGQTRLA